MSGGCKCCPLSVKRNLKFKANVVVLNILYVIRCKFSFIRFYVIILLHCMTLNSVIALFYVLSPNSIALQADYVTVVGDRPIISVKYCLPIPVCHFWPKLTHPAARSLCNSWTSGKKLLTTFYFEGREGGTFQHPKEAASHGVGTMCVRCSIRDTLTVPVDHSFGYCPPPEPYGVGDVLHVRPDSRLLRGRSVDRSAVAVIRNHLKKANFHAFDNLLQAFQFYDKVEFSLSVTTGQYYYY